VTNASIQKYMDIMPCPQLFRCELCLALGRNPEHFPWPIGWTPNIALKRASSTQPISLNHYPGVRIGVLYRIDEFGRTDSGLKDVLRATMKGWSSPYGRMKTSTPTWTLRW